MSDDSAIAALARAELGAKPVALARAQADAALANRTEIPVYELSDENLAKMVDVIVDVQPVLMDGYAEALDFLQKVYNQQKGQQEQQEREEPAAVGLDFIIDNVQAIPEPTCAIAGLYIS